MFGLSYLSSDLQCVDTRNAAAEAAIDFKLEIAENDPEVCSCA
jgi:hypothetical protein